jgi:hypothetical protein
MEGEKHPTNIVSRLDNAGIVLLPVHWSENVTDIFSVHLSAPQHRAPPAHPVYLSALRRGPPPAHPLSVPAGPVYLTEHLVSIFVGLQGGQHALAI